MRGKKKDTTNTYPMVTSGLFASDTTALLHNIMDPCEAIVKTPSDDVSGYSEFRCETLL